MGGMGLPGQQGWAQLRHPSWRAMRNAVLTHQTHALMINMHRQFLSAAMEREAGSS